MLENRHIKKNIDSAPKGEERRVERRAERETVQFITMVLLLVLEMPHHFESISFAISEDSETMVRELLNS